MTKRLGKRREEFRTLARDRRGGRVAGHFGVTRLRCLRCLGRDRLLYERATEMAVVTGDTAGGGGVRPNQTRTILCCAAVTL
jgi:hypothetical protein